MCAMVLDVVNCPAEWWAVADVRRQPLFQAANAAVVLQPASDSVESGAVLEGEERLLQEVGFGVPRHGDVLNVFEGDTAHGEHGLDRPCRESGPVLDTVEPLFLDPGVEGTVLKQNGRRVAVKGVDSK